VQPAREQFLAHAGFAQQQHRQVAGGHHAALLQQAAHDLAVRHDLPVVTGAGHRQAVVLLAARGDRTAVAQCIVLLLQPRHPHGRFHQPGRLGQCLARGGVEPAGGQAVQRQGAPGLAVLQQAHAHAVVHRQRFAQAVVDQAVVGVGQAAVLLETHHPVQLFGRRGGQRARRRLKCAERAGGHDGGQAGLLVQAEAPAQGIAHQPGRSHRAQAGRAVAVLQAEQGHRVAAELRPQAGDHPLQPQAGRQGGGQIVEKGRRVVRGHGRLIAPLWVKVTRRAVR
jgi:hypothetical protein